MKKIHGIFIFSVGSLIISCGKKETLPSNPNPTPIDTSVVVNPQVDPPVASTIGFFLDDWQPAAFAIPSATVPGSVAIISSVTVTVDRSNVITKIPRSFAGNNANSWMTQIVTEPALLDHISTLHPHIIRFPGGSISDKYFWNSPVNNPPADAPANLLDANGTVSPAGYWFGTNTASWTCSVNNYYTMLQQTNNKGMITVNYGYARYGTGADPVAKAAHLAADWVRYDNGRTRYWEIGNENFGDWEAGYRINTATNQDGQPEYLTGALYGNHFKVFADSMRKAALEIGKIIFIGAVVNESAPQSWWTPTATNWNNGSFSGAGNTPDFFIVHNYYTPYQTNASADVILETPQAVTQTMMDYVKQSVATAGITQKPVILGEYNITSMGSMQQVSAINGIHSLMVVGESLKNKIGMTARWDMANAWENGNDHGMFNIGDEPGGVPLWNPRPVFYYMYYFQKMLGDRLVSSASTSASIVSYASSFTSGETGTTLINRSAADISVEVKVQNFRKGNNFYWYKLTPDTDNGDFSRNVLVNGNGSSTISGGPAGYKTIAPYKAAADKIAVLVPARSAIFLVIDKK